MCLNRFGTPPERGRFRCEILNAAGDMVTMYVNIGEFSVIINCGKYYYTGSLFHSALVDVLLTITVAPITFSGSNTAGESYILECTVSVTGSTDQPTITWLDNGTEISSTIARMVSEITGSASSYSSTLTFNPLAASHAGTYTCRATLDSAMDSASRTITVQSE